MILWNDAETFSEVDLKVVGTYRYAEHPSTEILLMTYALDGGQVQTWSPAEGEPIPADLLAALKDPAVVKIAHNATFDRNVVPRSLHRMGLISATECTVMVSAAGWLCTMAQALAHALPADLDTLGRVLGLPQSQAKLASGKKLIQRFCKPAPKNHKARRYDHNTDPIGWGHFRQYAAQDVLAMRECHRRMPDWNFRHSEIALWRLDQRINDRGFFADRALVEASVRATETEKAELGRRFRELTRDLVSAPSQREKFKAFLLAEFGLVLENTQAETLRAARRQAPAGSPLAELLDIAAASNKTSTSKYARVLPAIGADGRVRGSLQYSAAGRTRRWGGRMFQPQNLPSRGLPPSEQVETYIDAVKQGIHTWLFDDLMLFGSAALRGVVTAPNGRHICAADLSNIEGRMLAWVSGEEWKLQAFRDYDAGTGPDLYNVTANMIIGVDPWNVPKKVRNVFGKVPDLSSGYAGGVAGYQNFAHAYGVRMADHWDTIKGSIAPEIIAKAQRNLGKPWAQQQLADLEISELEWVASEACKLAWRARHPATVAFWHDLERVVRNAIQTPGSVHRVTKLQVSCREHAGHLWLQILLPSGSRLCYFHPEITSTVTAVPANFIATDEDDVPTEIRLSLKDAIATCAKRLSGAAPGTPAQPFQAGQVWRTKAGEDLRITNVSDGTITYWGMATDEGSTSRVWVRCYTHGGKLTGNVCQTLARDVMAYNMPAIERAGYDIVLTVHDEVVGEAPEFLDEGEMVRALATNPPWSAGLPLAAAGFSAPRYKKED